MQPDMNKMMQEMAKAQQGILKVQQELAATTIEGSAGGGAVIVQCTGAMEFKNVKIKAEAVDPNDIGTLQDLVLMAIKDACQKAQALSEKKGKLELGNLKLPPGLGL